MNLLIRFLKKYAKTTIKLSEQRDKMADYDGFIDGFPTCWDYCDDRISKLKVDGLKPNTTYFNIYRAFIEWFDRQRLLFPIVIEKKEGETADLDQPSTTLTIRTSVEDGIVFVTQSNVEEYFCTVLAYIPTSSMKTLRRKISGLVWFLTFVEDLTPAAGTSNTIVYSNRINRSIVEQQKLHVAHNAKTNRGCDPHDKLRGLSTDEESIQFVNSIWRLRLDSPDLMYAYTMGRNAGLRGASSRKIKLCDLKLVYGFGPELKAPRNATLMTILRKGLDKTKSSTDQQVGVQPHKDFRRCAVFATAVLVVLKLRSLDKEINFLAGPPCEPAMWWHIPLNQYSTYSEESNATRQVLVAAGLLDKFAKVTHHRSMCVQYAGSQGLTSEQISTMTKHKQDKLHTAYMPDVERETLKVMSGFQKWEHRYVKTEHVKFPGRDQKVYLNLGIRFLLPRYDDYLKDYNSTLGDKSTAAENFLLHTLPYFCRRILECGYWFIRAYPEHQLTNLLKVRTVSVGDCWH